MAASISPYKAIADDTRRAILDLLRQGQLSAGAIAEHFRRVSRPAVSKHLSILHRARLVTVRVQGREHIYVLNAEPLREVQMWVLQYQRQWDTHLQALKDYLEASPREGESC